MGTVDWGGGDRVTVYTRVGPQDWELQMGAGLQCRQGWAHRIGNRRQGWGAGSQCRQGCAHRIGNHGWGVGGGQGYTVDGVGPLGTAVRGRGYSFKDAFCICFIYLFCVGFGEWAHGNHSTQAEVRGPLMGVGSLLLPCGFQVSNLSLPAP